MSSPVSITGWPAWFFTIWAIGLVFALVVGVILSIIRKDR